MAFSKIIFNGTTLMDVTSDTVAANNLLSGESATAANGLRVSGTVTVPTKTSDLTNDGSDGTHPFISDAGVTSFNGSTGAVTYTAPVTSVNGNTGAVTISVPTKVSDLTNDSGYLTTAVTSFNGDTGDVTYAAPVSSVNGQTGAVSLDIPDDWFALGTKITSGDLDDYQTAGRYFCEASDAASIAHKPTSSAFALYVAYIYNQWRPFQLAFDFDARFYVRVLTGNGWTGWTTSYPLLNDTTQTTAGVYALDAAVGKALADAISALATAVQGKESLVGDTAIPSAANLNSYTTLGTFYASSNNTASSLSNCPVTVACKLLVEGGTSPSNVPGHLRQTVTPYNAQDIYIRTSINSGGTWSAWKKVTLTNA